MKLLYPVISGLLLMLTLPATGQDRLPSPDQRPILTVSGAIAYGNDDRSDGPVARWDRAMLEQLEQVTIKTTTDWTDGISVFKGPRVQDILDRVGAEGDEVLATAINDYQVSIPISDFADYPVILAMTLDGRPLSRRDKGPLWIVYPRSDYPELQKPENNTKWIWQLKELIVQ